MPELPEVETVKRKLEDIYLGKEIKNVEVRYEKILANIKTKDFINNLINQKIVSFSRKGKYLIINLSNSHLLVHLRMEGKFKDDIKELDKHSHIIFYFTDGSILIYHDVRKFGKIFYFGLDEDFYNLKPLNVLGKDAIDNIDIDYLYQKIKKDSRKIKTVLLDQSVLAGIGNIYADEILFDCKINPTKIAKKLNKTDCKNIIDSASKILNEAIKDGGSTIKSFKSFHGIDGMFQQHLQVYGRQGEPCPRCNTLIVKEFVNQRGTHYCPKCQKG